LKARGVNLGHGGRHGEESYLNQAGVSIVFWYLVVGVSMRRSSSLGMIECVVLMYQSTFDGKSWYLHLHRSCTPLSLSLSLSIHTPSFHPYHPSKLIPSPPPLLQTSFYLSRLTSLLLRLPLKRMRRVARQARSLATLILPLGLLVVHLPGASSGGFFYLSAGLLVWVGGLTTSVGRGHGGCVWVVLGFLSLWVWLVWGLAGWVERFAGWGR
jgi:hypothetical protein